MRQRQKKQPQRRDNYKMGYEAFSKPDTSGIHAFVSGNPNRPNTTPYREWQRGFNAAYFKNLEKLNNGLTT